jgi:hypothetical protein
MRSVLRLVSGVALAGTIVPPVLYFAGTLELDQVKLWMLAATVAWFGTAPFWLGRKPGR